MAVGGAIDGSLRSYERKYHQNAMFVSAGANTAENPGARYHQNLDTTKT
jgi:hypothetical protein